MSQVIRIAMATDSLPRFNVKILKYLLTRNVEEDVEMEGDDEEGYLDHRCCS
jgi:hypothetical protein